MDLYNADCLTKLKDISSNSVDLVICDLPYGSLTGAKGIVQKKSKCYNQQSWDNKIDLELLWKELKRISKDKRTPILMFCSLRFLVIYFKVIHLIINMV